MGTLGRATCTIHSISALTSLEGNVSTKVKEYSLGLTVLIYILCMKAILLMDFAMAMAYLSWLIRITFMTGDGPKTKCMDLED
jgi:hypothetical protein